MLDQAGQLIEILVANANRDEGVIAMVALRQKAGQLRLGMILVQTGQHPGTS
jgi:hypothetical protein